MAEVSYLHILCDRMLNDDRVGPTHLSMYFALCQFWRKVHFTSKMRIVREELMQASKIRSIATYHKCIKELHDWDYIVYEPSYNPFSGSSVTFTESCSKESTESNLSVTNHFYSGSSSKFNPPQLFEVELFFSEKDVPSEEAIRFYHHYESLGWMVNGYAKMKNWNAAARNWISRLKKV